MYIIIRSYMNILYPLPFFAQTFEGDMRSIVLYILKKLIVYTHHFLHLAHHDRRPFEWPWLSKRRSSRSLALRQKGQQRKGTEQLGLVQLGFLP